MKSVQIIVVAGLLLIIAAIMHAEDFGKVIVKVSPTLTLLENDIALVPIQIQQGLTYPVNGIQDNNGDYVFNRVSPGWYQLGYLMQYDGFYPPDYHGIIDPGFTYTICRPIEVKNNQTIQSTLGFEGRDVIGRFVFPEDSKYVDQSLGIFPGIRAFYTYKPKIEMPLPDNYDQMSTKEKSEIRKKWFQSNEYQQKRLAQLTIPNHRNYVVQVDHDGSFKIKNVIPGTYEFYINFERIEDKLKYPSANIAGYHKKRVVIPAFTEKEKYTSYNLGNLTLKTYEFLDSGQKIQDFTITTIDGKIIRLAQLKGSIILLHFWSTQTTHGLPLIQEIAEKYQSSGVLKIIGINADIQKEKMIEYLANHNVPGDHARLQEQKDLSGFKDFNASNPSRFLLDKEGKFVEGYNCGVNTLITAIEKLITEK